jgi:hypothetical protein
MRAGELDLAAEDRGHLVGAAQVEVVADQPFEERPPGGGPVERLGVGDLVLAERQLIDVPGAQVRAGERRGRPGLPAPEEAGDRAGAGPVADPS